MSAFQRFEQMERQLLALLREVQQMKSICEQPEPAPKRVEFTGRIIT